MSEPITDAELDAIDAEHEAATPGPWQTKKTSEVSSYGPELFALGEYLGHLDYHHPNQLNNAKFIVRAHGYVPRLTREIRRLRERDKAVELYYRKYAVKFIEYKRVRQGMKLIERLEMIGHIAKKGAELSMEVDALRKENARLREEIEIFQGAPDETLGVEGYIDNLYDRMCKIFEFEQDGCGDEIRRLLFQILKHARMRGYSQGAHNYAKEQRALRAQLAAIRERVEPIQAVLDKLGTSDDEKTIAANGTHFTIGDLRALANTINETE